MPSWQADRYSSMSSQLGERSAGAGVALARPHLLDARAWRARTSANSAATKKPFSATSSSDAEQEQQLRSSRTAAPCGPLLRGGVVVAHRLMRRTVAVDPGVSRRVEPLRELEVVVGQPALGVRR